LFKNHESVEFFRPQITNDKNLSLENFLTYESESKTNELLQNFTLKIPENSQLCELVVLESNQTANQEFSNIFEAYNEFTKQFLGKYLFLKKKEELLKNCNNELKRWTAAQKNAEIALNHLKNNNRNEEIGHIIMANLHLIEKGTTLFVTNDFYTNQTIEIKLKENLNPQQNAAYYYKKARNQHTEEQLLANKMVLAAQKIEQNELKLVKLQQALKMNDLKSFFSAKTSQVKNQQIEQTEKHKEFSFKEFKILVGKSAANNDVLTLKIAHKNDLWLHAKGVSGSHVIIKHQQKEFSKEVIIYAAQLAAYYSKAKGSVLVPVIYCLKKFVRKPKGANPGQVIVEKEELIMVEPKLANI
jgi:predicted ribosome quality control (RQC) complex YloA/Tae2 family protein